MFSLIQLIENVNIKVARELMTILEINLIKYGPMTRLDVTDYRPQLRRQTRIVITYYWTGQSEQGSDQTIPQTTNLALLRRNISL